MVWSRCLLVCFPPSLRLALGGESGCGKVQNLLFRAVGPEYVRQDAVCYRRDRKGEHRLC